MPRGLLVDHSGKRFARWTVLCMAGQYDDPSGRRFSMCRVRCDCGNEKTLRTAAILSGASKSCGCYCREQIAARPPVRSNLTHGGTGTSEHRIWLGMRKRCNDERDPAYRKYGARGIRVCAHWASFANFLADMGRRPSPRHSIDRINNDGNYEPGNCRWATLVEQANNKRNNLLTTHEGKVVTCAEYARLLGIRYETAQHRIRQEKLGRKIRTRKPRKPPSTAGALGCTT